MNSLLYPLTVSAQVANPPTPQNYSQVVDILVNLFGILLPLLISLGLFLFVWGAVIFLAAQGSEESVRVAKKRMYWGIIILFVMVSFWGIISFLTEDFFGDGVLSIPFLPEN